MLHVDIPTRDDLHGLLTERGAEAVSIYLATTPVSSEIEASRIEFKNLTSEAVGRLQASGSDGNAVRTIEERLSELLEDISFWNLQANSLAIFATATSTLTFRLPSRIGSSVHVAERFHVKPLLRVTTFPHAAFLLALAQNSVRLIEVSPDLPAWPVHVDDLPTDAASAVGKASLGDRSPSGRLQGAEGRKHHLASYARQVDAAIRPVLTGSGLPLILAATAPLDAIFRGVCTYPMLVEQGVPGNPEGETEAQLATAARPVLDDLYAAELAAVRARFDERRATGRASTDIADIARAATFGAVDTLIVDIERAMPGSVDEESGAVTFDTGSTSYGIIDEVARRVILNGGRVLAVRAEDVPEGAAAAALLRYAI
jgi:hypothetical protein